MILHDPMNDASLLYTLVKCIYLNGFNHTYGQIKTTKMLLFSVDSSRYLTEGQDRSPAPAVHHQDAEDVARDLDEDAQEEVGVGIAREAGGGE